jgi:hypothetical protein
MLRRWRLLLLGLCCHCATAKAQTPPAAGYTACDSCRKPSMKQNWWKDTGLNCPVGGDAGLCDICVGKGNSAAVTKACQTAATPEECCELCMMWNDGYLPGGLRPGNSMRCTSWYFRTEGNGGWCGLKDCEGPGKCGPAAPGPGMISGTACSQGGEWGWPAVVLVVGAGSSYLVLGLLYSSTVQGVAPLALRLHSHPHFERWVGVKALVVDGWLFSSGMLLRRRRPPRARLEPLLQPQGGGGAAMATGSATKSKKEKKAKGHKQKKGGSSSPQPVSPPNATASSGSPSTMSSSSSKHTAAGSGGRWVHLPG